MTRRDDRKPDSKGLASDDHTFGELLCAYLDDELGPAQRTEVEARLKTDPSARALLEELALSAEALRSLPRGTAPSAIIDDITAQSERADLLGKPEDSVTLARHKRGPFKSTMAVAAMLMVAVTASLYVALQVKQPGSSQRKLETEGFQEAAASKDGLMSTSSYSRSPQSRSKHETILTLGDDLKQRGRELLDRSDQNAGTGDIGIAGRIQSAPSSNPSAEETKNVPVNTAVTKPAHSAAPANITTSKFEASGYAKGKKKSAKPKNQLADVSFEDVEKLAKSSLDETLDSTETTVGGEADDAKSLKPSGALLARLDPEMTFEQKLIAGAGVEVLESHVFSNEPLQLSISFDNSDEQDAGEKRLQTFFRSNALRAVTSESTASLEGLRRKETQPGLAGDAESGDIEIGESELYFEGHSIQNSFAPVNSRQYLVRLQSSKLDQVVNDLTKIGAANIQLAVGNMKSEGPEQLMRLTHQAMGEAYDEDQHVHAQTDAQSRLQVKERVQEESNAEPSPSFPETAQWIQALQSYGLLAKDDATNTSGEGHPDHPNRAAADATTNGLFHKTSGLAARAADKMQATATGRQKLLTLVIELVNKPPADKANLPKKTK